jgi:hypothetical protein
MFCVVYDHRRAPQLHIRDASEHGGIAIDDLVVACVRLAPRPLGLVTGRASRRHAELIEHRQLA